MKQKGRTVEKEGASREKKEKKSLPIIFILLSKALVIREYH